MDTDFAFASVAEFAQKMEREFPLHVAALSSTSGYIFRTANAVKYLAKRNRQFSQ